MLNFSYLECFTAAPFTGEGFADTGLCTGQGIGSRAAFYQGTATLTAVETPIPEPGTMALVGSSLAMVLARSRTRSRLRRSGERH